MGKYNIKKLYTNYFQKSRVFLYPALEIKRGIANTPVETYISWKDKINPSDRLLICLFNLKDNADFLNFEEHKLLNNPLFCDYFELGDNKALYVFTFEDYRYDWHYFRKGEYSKLSPKLKGHIRKFYGEKSSNYKLIHSYLYPEEYYEEYSNLLNVNINVLKDVKELCNKPDLTKEILQSETVISPCKITEL